ncbi:sensor histidine kinase [Bradyrhizobium sp. McL0616]|uniref:sensor histidine kinase n=1 Tax=Bradyrhizobium sp. McL0616 TaxID=3415674 RepID=UPI003CF7C21A
MASTAYAAQPLPRSVLLIDQENQSRYWNFDLSNAFRAVLNTEPGVPIIVYADNLDLARVAGPLYENALRAFFVEKYRDVSIGVIVVNGARALDFVLALRADLWPNVPIVLAAVDDAAADRAKSVPDVTGHIMRLTLKDIVATARSVVPDLKRVALVGDPFDRNTFFRGFLAEIPELQRDLEFIDLTGLPMDQIKQRVATLPPQTAIAYTTLTVDGAGIDYLPREAIAQVASVANRPIVTGTENFIGYGAVGGMVVQSPPIGREAGRLVLRLLNGESASDIPITVGDFKKPMFDWRELQRWNVSEAELPPDSELRFRKPGMWEQYRWQVILVSIALLGQATAIFILLLERRRRIAAQIDSRTSLLQAVHMNRAAAAGALSASVSHELNQPLGAILINTEIADLLMTSDVIDVSRVQKVLSAIRKDDQRAAEIIKRLSVLLKGSQVWSSRELDLNDAVHTAIKILEPEAIKRGVALRVDLDQQPLTVRSDEIHVQQIVLNLVLNGMDSIPPGAIERQIVVRTQKSGPEATVSISDSGTGIPDDKLAEIFEPFVTTKPHGTGLGLSLARTIVESYGGRIWAGNRREGGAIFCFSLALVPAK